MSIIQGLVFNCSVKLPCLVNELDEEEDLLVFGSNEAEEDKLRPIASQPLLIHTQNSAYSPATVEVESSFTREREGGGVLPPYFPLPPS